MPVRNGAKTLAATLNSIFNQTYPNFEVIIIDDASIDETPSILSKWHANYSNLRIFQASNSGLVSALNRGLEVAEGEYIARMDADDEMLPFRLERQVHYFQQNPKVDLVASQVSVTSDEPLSDGFQHYIDWQNKCLSHDDIVQEMYVESPLAHPSVMIKTDQLRAIGGYQQGEFPEDYQLWLRMMDAGYQFAKIPEVLLHWRDSAERTSRQDPRYAKQAFDLLRRKYLLLDKRLDGSRPLVFWGAGRRTRMRLKPLMALGLMPSAWIDIDPKKIGNKLDGVWIHAPQFLTQLETDKKPYVLSFVTNHGASEEIGKQLSFYGYFRGRDYLMVG